MNNNLQIEALLSAASEQTDAGEAEFMNVRNVRSTVTMRPPWLDAIVIFAIEPDSNDPSRLISTEATIRDQLVGDVGLGPLVDISSQPKTPLQRMGFKDADPPFMTRFSDDGDWTRNPFRRNIESMSAFLLTFDTHLSQERLDDQQFSPGISRVVETVRQTRNALATVMDEEDLEQARMRAFTQTDTFIEACAKAREEREAEEKILHRLNSAELVADSQRFMQASSGSWWERRPVSLSSNHVPNMTI